MDHIIPGRAADRHTDRFECVLPASADSLSKLRARFARWLGGVVDNTARRNDLVLVMSEVAAATLGGRGVTDHTMRAQAWSDETGVVVQAVDEGSGPRDEAEDAGRGFSIVATLADVLTVREVGGTTQIRARMAWRAAGAGEPVFR